MKRFLVWLWALALLYSLAMGPVEAAAGDNCIDFNDGTMCLQMDKDGDRYELTNSISNYDGEGYPIIFCQVKEPGDAGSTLYHVADCDDEFTYDGTTNGYFTVYVWFNNDSETLKYDIRDEEWTTVDGDDGDGDVGNVTQYDIDTDDTTPEIDQEVDLYVTPKDSDGDVDKDYDEQARIKVYKRDSDGDYDEVSTTYYSVDDATPRIDLDGSSRENLSNYIYFKREGRYRVKIYEDGDSDVYGYEYFTVGDSNDGDGEVVDYDISTDDTTPEVETRVDLYVKPQDSDGDTDEDYDEQARIKVYKRDSSGNYDEVSTTYYRVSDSTPQIDLNGSSKETLSDYLYFKEEGRYRIKIYEDGDEDIYGYEYFTVGDGDSDGEVVDYEVSTDDTTPNVSQKVDLVVKPQDNDGNTVTDYDEQARIKVYKRDSDGNYDEVSTTYYRVSDSTPNVDLDGSSRETLSDYIYFKENGRYRVKIYEDGDEDIYGYEYFTVGGGDDDNDTEVAEYVITTDDITPNVDTDVDIKVRPQDEEGNAVTDYNEQAIIKVYKKNSSDDYVEVSTSYYDLTDDTPTINPDGSSVETLSNYLSFSQEGEYRVKVYEEDETTIYGYEFFTVGNINVDEDDAVEYEVTASDTTVDTNDEIDLYVKPKNSDEETITDYNKQAVIRVYKKQGDGTYDQVSTTYYAIEDSTPRIDLDGTSRESLESYLYFKREGTYRVKIYEDGDTEIFGNVYVIVGDEDDDDSDSDAKRYDITTNDKTPRRGQKVDIDVQPEDVDGHAISDYDEEARVEVQKRDANKDYKKADSDEYWLDETTIDLDLDGSSREKFDDFVSFDEDGVYRLKIYEKDDEDIYGYVYFTVGEGVSDDDVSEYDISTSDTTPKRNQKVDIFVRPKNNDGNIIENYNKQGAIKIYKRDDSGIYRESSKSNYRISDTTPQIDVDGGSKATLDNHIYFKEDGRYKVKVYEYGKSSVGGYEYFIVGTDSSGSSDGDENVLEVTTDDTTPSINQKIDLKVRPEDSDGDRLSSYNEEVKIKVYRKKDNGLYTEATSSYYTLKDTTPRITTNSSSSTETLSDYISFKQEGRYKITIYQINDVLVKGILYVTTTKYDGVVEVNGFTDEEYEKVQRYYNVRPAVVQKLRDKYPEADGDSVWESMQREMYSNMRDVLDDESHRKFDNYNQFWADLVEFVRYTVRLR